MTAYSSYTGGLVEKTDLLALKHGTGFFETLLYNGEKVCHLEAHLKRIFNSITHFGIEYEEVDFESVIHNLIQESGLQYQTARINIYYPIFSLWGQAIKPFITVEPYTLLSEQLVRLCVYPNKHDSFLAQHKSMSYFPYSLAKRYARQRGFDDAIMLDSQGIFAETATSALLFKLEDQWCMSGVKHKLDSVALSLAESLFGPLAILYISEHDFGSVDYFYVLNSLIGIRPVSSIGDVEIPVDWEGCEDLNTKVLCQAAVVA